MELNLTTDTKRKYLILCGILLLIMTIYKYIVHPAFLYVERMGEEIVLKHKMLSGYKKVIHGKNNLQYKLASIKKELLRAESGLLKENTPAMASVEIQNRLNKIVEESGVELKSMKILDPVVTDYYTMLPVQYNIVSDTRALRDMLYKIETSPVYLTIDELRVRVRKKMRRRFQARQYDYEINSILTITGYSFPHK
jgi:Tfp pilus assembly protein PilO